MALRDLKALEILLDHGADPTLPTRIDDLSTPLQDAQAIGFAEAVDLLAAVSAEGNRRFRVPAGSD